MCKFCKQYDELVSSSLLAPASSAVVLADACPAASLTLALASFAVVLANAQAGGARGRFCAQGQFNLVFLRIAHPPVKKAQKKN